MMAAQQVNSVGTLAAIAVIVVVVAVAMLFFDTWSKKHEQRKIDNDIFKTVRKARRDFR